jgi:hypothetical protein
VRADAAAQFALERLVELATGSRPAVGGRRQRGIVEDSRRRKKLRSCYSLEVERHLYGQSAEDTTLINALVKVAPVDLQTNVECWLLKCSRKSSVFPPEDIVEQLMLIEE